MILGVIKHKNESEYGALSFTQPKAKSNSVQFMSDSRNLNMQLKHKNYTMPRICEMLLKLEAFKYSNSLNINTRYYYIHLSEKASNICMIIIPRGKYR